MWGNSWEERGREGNQGKDQSGNWGALGEDRCRGEEGRDQASQVLSPTPAPAQWGRGPSQLARARQDWEPLACKEEAPPRAAMA